MEEASDDPFLAELMTWATTVVRLARNTPDSSWLADDLERFPSQFLLFSPHVEQLVLENQETLERRTISATQEGDEVVLEDDGESRWRVFAIEHRPSDAARLDAGAMADRDRIPLVWAVPTRRGRRGEFWAFFPTLDQTTLSGVVNAPWKLNEDRTRIIDGPFNAELIERLSALGHGEPPTSLLARRPRRSSGAHARAGPRGGRVGGCTADGPRQRAREDLADPAGSGVDATFSARAVASSSGDSRPTLAIWAEQPTRPVDWVHASVETRDRRARVEMYMDTKAARLGASSGSRR